MASEICFLKNGDKRNPVNPKNQKQTKPPQPKWMHKREAAASQGRGGYRIGGEEVERCRESEGDERLVEVPGAVLQVPRVCERAPVAARTQPRRKGTTAIRTKPPRTQEGGTEREGRSRWRLPHAGVRRRRLQLLRRGLHWREDVRGGQGRAADLGPAGRLGTRVLPGDRSAPTTTSAAARAGEGGEREGERDLRVGGVDGDG